MQSDLRASAPDIPRLNLQAQTPESSGKSSRRLSNPTDLKTSRIYFSREEFCDSGFIESLPLKDKIKKIAQSIDRVALFHQEIVRVIQTIMTLSLYQNILSQLFQDFIAYKEKEEESYMAPLAAKLDERYLVVSPIEHASTLTDQAFEKLRTERLAEIQKEIDAKTEAIYTQAGKRELPFDFVPVEDRKTRGVRHLIPQERWLTKLFIKLKDSKSIEKYDKTLSQWWLPAEDAKIKTPSQLLNKILPEPLKMTQGRNGVKAELLKQTDYSILCDELTQGNQRTLKGTFASLVITALFETLQNLPTGQKLAKGVTIQEKDLSKLDIKIINLYLTNELHSLLATANDINARVKTFQDREVKRKENGELLDNQELLVDFSLAEGIAMTLDSNVHEEVYRKTTTRNRSYTSISCVQCLNTNIDNVVALLGYLMKLRQSNHMVVINDLMQLKMRGQAFAASLFIATEVPSSLLH